MLGKIDRVKETLDLKPGDIGSMIFSAGKDGKIDIKENIDLKPGDIGE